jgi:histidinol-phosphate aminotransferase
MSLIQENVAKLSAYAVDQGPYPVKLNQNEAPEDVPPEFKEEVWKKLKKRGWNRYPVGDPNELRERIAASTGFSAQGILVGNGSNELIQALYIAVCGRGDSVLTVKPGFAIYKRMASLFSTRLVEIPLKVNFSFDVPAIVSQAASVRMVILASPNNPTGTTLTPDEIDLIAGKTAGLLVVDEAYYEFCGQTAQSLICTRDNIVILRTLSKAWRLAGARLGYLLGREEFVRDVAKAKLPFSVGVFAQAAAEVMLSHREHMEQMSLDVVRERDRVFQALTKIPGIVPIPSSANFILFKVQGHPASLFYEELRDKGILVRFFDDPSLKKHLRVTIGSPNENSAFLAAVRELMKGGAP